MVNILDVPHGAPLHSRINNCDIKRHITVFKFLIFGAVDNTEHRSKMPRYPRCPRCLLGALHSQIPVWGSVVLMHAYLGFLFTVGIDILGDVQRFKDLCDHQCAKLGRTHFYTVNPFHSCAPNMP